jgi:hypothetical protein
VASCRRRFAGGTSRRHIGHVVAIVVALATAFSSIVVVVVVGVVPDAVPPPGTTPEIDSTDGFICSFEC